MFRRNGRVSRSQVAQCVCPIQGWDAGANRGKALGVAPGGRSWSGFRARSECSRIAPDKPSSRRPPAPCATPRCHEPDASLELVFCCCIRFGRGGASAPFARKESPHLEGGVACQPGRARAPACGAPTDRAWRALQGFCRGGVISTLDKEQRSMQRSE